MLQWILANPVLTSVIVTVLIALGTGIWKAARWVQKTEDATSGTAAVLQKLQQKLLDELKELRAIILARHPLTAATMSPLQLNALGQRVVDILGADEWAKQTALRVMNEVEGLQPFQVDEFSDNYVQTRLEDPWVKERVPACAYQLGIDRPSVLLALRVVLRDELLRLQPNPVPAAEPGEHSAQPHQP